MYGHYRSHGAWTKQKSRSPGENTDRLQDGGTNDAIGRLVKVAEALERKGFLQTDETGDTKTTQGIYRPEKVFWPPKRISILSIGVTFVHI
jgi:hypothetical protein